MIYGYARVSIGGQSVAAQACQHRAAGAGHVFRGTARGAKTDWAELRKALAALEAGGVLVVTRLERLARSTRDLLNTVATIAACKAGFRCLRGAWADTTTAHSRLMLIVLGRLAEFEREPVRAKARGRAWAANRSSPRMGRRRHCAAARQVSQCARLRAVPTSATA